MKRLVLLASLAAVIFLTGCNFLQPNTAPDANFICTTSHPTAQVPVSFSAIGSLDKEDGQNLAARWDFNQDGIWEIDYSHGKKITDPVSYTYTTPGTYTVKLEVRDSANATDSTVLAVAVASAPVAPVAQFSFAPHAPVVNETVTFDPTASTDDVDTPDKLATRWDFNGDGVWEIDYAKGNKANQPVTYSYSQAGKYAVTLEVKDSAGLTGMLRKDVVVKEQINTPPMASFYFTPAAPLVGEAVTFSAVGSTDAENGNNLQARWDFNGDGTWEVDYAAGKKATDVVTYTFTTPGTYNVSLEVKDVPGLTNVKTLSLTVVNPLTSTISGSVIESRGGSGLGGVTLALTDLTGKKISTTSATDGSFQFKVCAGTYQLVATKSGLAASKVQDLQVKDQEEVHLEFPLREKIYANWPAETPSLSISGLPASDHSNPLSSTVNFTVAGVSNRGVRLVEVRFGQEGVLLPNLSFVDQKECPVAFNTQGLPNGDNYIKINLYDANNNYVETYKKIYVANNLTQQLVSPEIIQLCATTFGQSLKLLSQSSLKVPDQVNSKIDLGRVSAVAKEANTTVVVAMLWKQVANASAYKIYRSFNGSDYTLIASVSTNQYIDGSSNLAPLKEVFYRIVACAGNTESTPSTAVSTIPLPSFNVSLVSPAMYGKVDSSLPVFSWTDNQLVGDNQWYHLIVRGVTDSWLSMDEQIISETSTPYAGIELQNGKEYIWDLIDVYAFSAYSDQSMAVSYSGTGSGAINGEFRFTTDFK